MQVDIWSDVACPWCAVGKRRFEAALARFEHRDAVTVRWRSFELDPTAPARKEGTYAQLLADKYGGGPEQAQAMIDRMVQTAAGDGLAMDFERIQPGNTFDAHRLLHLAADAGVQDAVKERFVTAYLCEGAAIGERATLERLAVDAGLDADEVRTVLDSERYADAVRAEERAAADLGINGVPFFVIDRRYGVSGAQPADVLLGALERAWSDRPLVTIGGTSDADADGGACADGSCAV